MQGQNGIQNQSNVFNQLQGVANGTGPNPALAQLNQATAANTANQAALMAGQRGAGANAGLMARQAAMQGGANQQNAAGQAATMQANQQLGALQGLGNLATQQVGQQQQATGQLNQFQQAEQQNLLNSIAGTNQANVQSQASINSANAERQASQNAMTGQIISGLAAGVGTAAQTHAGAALQTHAQGGLIEDKSHVYHYFKAAEGGQVPALLSPGEKYLPPQAVKQVAQGADPMQVGKTVPGKPKVGGSKNSYANDIVPATLETGGIVLPRSVTKSDDASAKADAFVRAILAKKRK